jgi:hypothetical protein
MEGGGGSWVWFWCTVVSGWEADAKAMVLERFGAGGGAKGKGQGGGCRAKSAAGQVRWRVPALRLR